ncbi:MAG TPA: hypothetical protein VFV99_25100 [Kofleriaceae bacterium]|nr:hypothetical protein [Kofleriaceae bacterium]
MGHAIDQRSGLLAQGLPIRTPTQKRVGGSAKQNASGELWPGEKADAAEADQRRDRMLARE